MEKQLTAVEWLFWKLYILKDVEYESIMQLYEQAKEMEKEQIIEAYHEGQLCILDFFKKRLVPMGFESTSYKEDKEDANEYYKITFKSE